MAAITVWGVEIPLVPGTEPASFFLLETGDHFLLETGDDFLLEGSFPFGDFDKTQLLIGASIIFGSGAVPLDYFRRYLNDKGAVT